MQCDNCNHDTHADSLRAFERPGGIIEQWCYGCLSIQAGDLSDEIMGEPGDEDD